MIKNLSYQIDCGYSEGMLGFLQQPQHRTPPAQPQEQLQLPFLQVRLLVNLNSYQRHPEHPQGMDTAGHTDRAQAATALTYRIHRIHKPFSSRSGRSKMSLVQGYTQYSLGSQAHMHLHGSLEYWHGPSVCPIAPVRPQSLFLTTQVSSLPDGPVWCLLQTHKHTLLLQAPHVHRSPRYQCGHSTHLAPLTKHRPKHKR